MWRDVDEDLAHEAAARWGADTGTLAHVADHGNSVWRFEQAGTLRYLRIGHPHHRSIQDSESEVAFVRHLHARGVEVAAPLPSQHGRFVEPLSANGLALHACAFANAPGDHVPPEAWDATLLHAWGRALGRIHAASSLYEAPPDARRWTWEEEPLVAQAATYVPAHAKDVLDELDEVRAHLRALPRDATTYGMTHADFAPQNFRYTPPDRIVAFDFGNCCWHAFSSDVAISISVLGRRPQRDTLRAALLAGYRETWSLDADTERELRWYLRLRRVYFYLSRCRGYGPDPTDEQRAALEEYRARVGPQASW